MAKKTGKRSFVLYHAIRKPLEKLNDEQRGQLFLAILNYSEFGTEPDFEDSSVDIAFEFIRDALDKDTAAWEEKSQRRAEAGSKGGKQKVANLANATFAKQNVANQAVSVSASVSVSESDIKENIKKKKQFVPPTLEEVKAYVIEKGYRFDAEAFYSFYESNGWKVGKNPMKSWKDACTTWEKRESSSAPKSKKLSDMSNDKVTPLSPEERQRLKGVTGK